MKNKIWRWSTATKLTLFNAGVLVFCFGLLLAFTQWMSMRFMQEHIEESVKSELSLLVSEYDIDGREGMLSLIRERVLDNSPEHERYYRFEDPKTSLVISNLAAWPDSAASPGVTYFLPSPGHPGKTRLMTRWQSLPQGERLLVGFDEYELHSMQRKLRQSATLSLVIVLLLAWLAGRFITRTALRPIETIRHSAGQIMDGDMRHRIPHHNSGDEFDQLAITLNRMLDRISHLIAGIEGTTDNIAHDLRSPLTRHRARLEAALHEQPTAAEWPRWVEKNIGDIDQVLSTFQSLLKIARVDSGVLRKEFAAVDLAKLCHDAVEYVEPLAEARDIQFDLSIPEQASLQGHRDLLFQLLINVLDNALKYAPSGSRVLLLCERQGSRWLLRMADQGPGIPEAERVRVFERLYRLDSTRLLPGLGLGLSLVQAVVSLHRGHVTLADAAPGLQVNIHLPLS
ncbi:MAG: HAMP domain-containing sensor histidine kinase [Paraperlucidibaca sp.]